MAIYYEPSATDEEIKNCEGDYIGCEICRFQARCLQMTLEDLKKAMKNNYNSNKK